MPAVIARCSTNGLSASALEEYNTTNDLDYAETESDNKLDQTAAFTMSVSPMKV